MSNELMSKSIEELAPLIREKKISPVDVTEAILTQTEKYNQQLNAYLEITRDQAVAAAQGAEREIMEGRYRGPLHGIPMALKDMFYFKDEVVTVGSKIHQRFVPQYNATVVHKLQQEGVIFTGKLNLHEYALGSTTTNPHFGACRNPWDLARVPGGSSGGSGAAVASHMTVASLGTDTAGSVRIPSSCCGTIGLKPTYGRISKYGLYPLNWSKDHVGPITKTVYDSALLLEILAGYDPQDPTSANIVSKKYTQELTDDIQGMVIGVNEAYYVKHVDQHVEHLTRQALQQLEDLGARIEVVDIPTLAYAEFALHVINVAEASAIHHQHLVSRPDDFGNDVRMMLELGELVSAVDYIQAQQIRYKLTQDFAQAFEKIDVLVTPTLPCLPSKIGEDNVEINGKVCSFLNESIRFTGPLNLTGSPAISIPCGLSNGLPVGLQIIGPSFREENILRVAYVFEQTYPLQDQQPRLLSQEVEDK